MPTVDAQLIEALNLLLEDVRASVEIAVALSLGATVNLERIELAAMGSEDVAACVAIREALEHAEAPISRQINGIVLQVLGMERYDERLRGYAQHQLASGQEAQRLAERVADPELRQWLQTIYETHMRHALWCEQRAEAFAATRTLEFRVSLGPVAERERFSELLEAERAEAATTQDVLAPDARPLEPFSLDGAEAAPQRSDDTHPQRRARTSAEAADTAAFEARNQDDRDTGATEE